MIDNLRAALVSLTVSRLTDPRPPVIRAWFWLAAGAVGREDRRRCLGVLLRSDSENGPANLGFLGLDQGRAPG